MVQLGGEARALGRQAGPDRQTNQEHDDHDAAHHRSDGPGTYIGRPQRGRLDRRGRHQNETNRQRQARQPLLARNWYLLPLPECSPCVS